jgi:hypothetical protein
MGGGVVNFFVHLWNECAFCVIVISLVATFIGSTYFFGVNGAIGWGIGLVLVIIGLAVLVSRVEFIRYEEAQREKAERMTK